MFELDDSLTTYKLMILRILAETDYPLTDSQLSEFFVSHRYIDYFQFRQIISELGDAGYLSSETIRNMSRYHITDPGKEALELFDYKIPWLWLNDILTWLHDKGYDLRRQVENTADYYPVKRGWRTEYMVEACIREKGEVLLNLTLNVVSKEQAMEICDKWQKKSDLVYGSLMDILLLDSSNSEDSSESTDSTDSAFSSESTESLSSVVSSKSIDSTDSVFSSESTESLSSVLSSESIESTDSVLSSESTESTDLELISVTLDLID